MKQALGLVEIRGLSTAIVVADTMAKAANVEILEIENTRGLGYMSIKIVGDVGAVNAAVQAGRQVGITNQKLVSSKVIPRPSDYVENTFCRPPEPPEPEKTKVLEPEPESEKTKVPEPTPEVKAEEPAPEPEQLTLEPEVKPEEPQAETGEQPKKARKSTAKKTTSTRKKGKETP